MAKWFSFRKSEQPSDQPPSVGAAGNGGGNAVTGGVSETVRPDPEKARRWFEHAKISGATGNYDYALTCFAKGIRLDPTDLAAHEAMWEAAVQYFNAEGKPASGKEIRQ